MASSTTRSVAKVPDFLRRGSKWSSFKERVSALASEHLNFYRIHVIFFILTPLIFSAIFYAANSNPISYIDCLFVTCSAMTVTGLVTISISETTPFQQAILFFLMCIGNLSTVSITMVWIRRHFFRMKFDHIVRTSAKARERAEEVDKEEKAKRRMILKKMGFVRSLTRNNFGRSGKNGGGSGRRRSSEHEMNETESRNSTSSSHQDTDSTGPRGQQHHQSHPQQQKKKSGRKKGPLRADMIRRMDGPAVLISPTGERSHLMPASERMAEEGFATMGGSGERKPIPERSQEVHQEDKPEIIDSDWQDEEEGTTTAAAFARAERRARAIAQAEAFDRANNYAPGQTHNQSTNSNTNSNSNPGSGGILNNSSSEDYPPNPSSPTFPPNSHGASNHHHGGFSSQPPSIRISLPRNNGHPSAANAFMLDSTIAESPDQMSNRNSRNNSGDQNVNESSEGNLGTNGRTGSFEVSRTRSALLGRGEADLHANGTELGRTESRTAEPSRTRFSDLETNYFVGSGVGITQTTHDRIGRPRRDSDPQGFRGHFRRGSDTGPTRGGHGGSGGGGGPVTKTDFFPRTHTVEFAEPSRESRQTERANTTALPGVGTNAGGMRHRNMSVSGLGGANNGLTFERTLTGRSIASGGGYGRRPAMGVPLARTQTSSKQRGFGGFPTPLEIASTAIKTAFPRVQTALTRSTTMNRTSTIASMQSGGANSQSNLDGVKTAPYLSFDLTVSGNSRFHELTEAQRDELGGVEYRAIDLLSKLIPAYLFIVTFFNIIVVAPILKSRLFDPYEPVFDSQGLNRPDTTWFWFFQVVSAYTNTGMSLIDTSMTEMQNAYYMLIPMGFLILAGNTAFPIVLRFFIWCISISVPKSSRIYETIRFLLDHPRRCFVYLFPARQTWFLLGVLCVLNATDWVAFLVLDIGNEAIEQIPVGTRVLDGLFQSIAVRAAGFQTVSLLNLAPSVQMLYVIMMYISVYPIAMSVRSTNVYEERSLGIWEDYKPPDLVAEEDQLMRSDFGKARLWGSYLAAHATKQLSFDIWILALSLWVVCIIERTNIQDPSSNDWFTIFSCLFELTSAYGTVGLSLGTPTDNFSLSGRFSTLSKLVVICVMIRGRHRGLPVAIDRAVLLPDEVEVEDADPAEWSIVDQDALSNFGANTNPSIRVGTQSQSRNPSGNALSPKQSFGGGLGGRAQTTRRDSSAGSGLEPPTFFLDSSPNQALTTEPQSLEAIHETKTPALSREGSQRRNDKLEVVADEKKDSDQGSEKHGNSSISDVENSKIDGIDRLESGPGGNPSTSSEQDSGESSNSAHQKKASQEIKRDGSRSSASSTGEDPSAG